MLLRPLLCRLLPALQVHRHGGACAEWHFLIEGPSDSPYAGGWYLGKLRCAPQPPGGPAVAPGLRAGLGTASRRRFPPEYPFKPPGILMLTPSGRFETGTRLCLSMSDFHPETW